MSESQAAAGGRSDVLVTAGEFYLDLIFYDLPAPPRMGEELKTDNFAFAPGGGAAITAAATARLGRPAQLVAVLGDSPLDAAARSFLNELDVSLEGARVEPGTLSGLSVAVSTRADRYFLTCPGANQHLREFLLSDSGKRKLSRAGHVHLALATDDWEPFVELIEELRASGTTTSWDMGWDPEAASAPGFRRLCERLNVLFFNEMEALRYTGSSRVEDAVAKLSHPGNTVVVKLGKSGAVASDRGSALENAPGIKVDAIESTGAGDAFNAGFLNLWMAGAPLRECLRAGNICGGLSTRSPGGVGALPSQEEFEQVFREQP